MKHWIEKERERKKKNQWDPNRKVLPVQCICACHIDTFVYIGHCALAQQVLMIVIVSGDLGKRMTPILKPPNFCWNSLESVSSRLAGVRSPRSQTRRQWFEVVPSTATFRMQSPLSKTMGQSYSCGCCLCLRTECLVSQQRHELAGHETEEKRN